VIWWLNQPTRALTEKAEIAALADRVPWLSGIKWSHDFPTLTADFDLLVADKQIPLRLIYEQLFPDFPARIVARDETLISAHQYGPKGELCLEWRADNWQPDITGAMLIESAYRLLSTEKNEGKSVPSAHHQTLGQEVRKSVARFVLSENARRALLALPEGGVAAATLLEHRFGETWVAELTALGPEDARIWEGPALFTVGKWKCWAPVMRVPIPSGGIDKAWLEARLGDTLTAFLEKESQPYFIFAHDADVLLCQWVGPPGNQTVYSYRTVDLPTTEERLDRSHATLAGKLVGIVGCGSVGSKVARSLVRSGIDHLVLVDSDIVFPGNLVRNELDLRAVGVNKTAALKAAILEVKSDVVVDTHDILLGRQESAAWTASVALKLSKCDVLIDATADINAFGVISAIAQAYSKPMIWGRVYEGGLGGLIARARPDLDPVPQAARRQIDGWFQQKGIPWKASAETRSYGSTVEGAPIVATDGDVGVIAMNITRLALDALLLPTQSAFPYSAYALGFSSAWIFTQPFDVWPIELVSEGQWGAQVEEDRGEKLTQLFNEFFPDEAATSEG